jgi:hypothetical protein
MTLIEAAKQAEKQEPDLSEQGRNRSAVLGNNIEAFMDAGLPFLKALETAIKVYDHQANPPPAQRTFKERNHDATNQSPAAG